MRGHSAKQCSNRELIVLILSDANCPLGSSDIAKRVLELDDTRHGPSIIADIHRLREDEIVLAVGKNGRGHTHVLSSKNEAAVASKKKTCKMKKYTTTVGILQWDEYAHSVKSADDPFLPAANGNWRMVGSVLGELRQSQQPILWFWEADDE